MRKLALGMIVIGLLLATRSQAAEAGGVKWAKAKWACKDGKGTELKGSYKGPKGFTLSTDAEPACPRMLRLDAPAGMTARIEFATVRGRVSVDERAKWHIKDAVVTTKGGWTCGEGIAVDWNGNPATPPLRAVRCAKLQKDGSVIVASLVAAEATFAALGGQKALRAALPALKGLAPPLENES